MRTKKQMKSDSLVAFFGFVLVLSCGCASQQGDPYPEVVRLEFYSGGQVPVSSTITVAQDGEIALLNPGERARRHRLSADQFETINESVTHLREAIEGHGEVASCGSSSGQPNEGPGVVFGFDGLRCEFDWWGIPEDWKRLATLAGDLGRQYFGHRFHSDPADWPSSLDDT